MRPQNLKTKIFLDSSSAEDTKVILSQIGFLDGQTTNPSYFSLNPKITGRVQNQGKFTEKELYEAYKQEVQAISKLIPQGSVSIEVYADKNTKANKMLAQAKEMFSWIPNAHIKFPITSEGLKAASMAVKEGLRINMTLCFQQEQAAAVYAATKEAKRGQVFVSPFMGRHFDRGTNGIHLVRNVIEMYKKGDGHVLVLASSMRSIDHLYACLQLESDIITAGFKYLQEWAKNGVNMPGVDFIFEGKEFQEIPYREISLERNYWEYDIYHDLTDIGLEKFAADWNNLLKFESK